MSSHWNIHANQWNNIGIPLRPSSCDIQIVSSWIQEIMSVPSPSFNVLILGATPELAEISWPEHTNLFAVDANLTMMQSQLLQKKYPFKSVANWLQLPLPDSSINLVIGDGCYTMLAEKEYDILSNEIVRVLHPEGHFFMRFFMRPEENESIELIQADFLAGKINNFHILKWRIAMALHNSLEQGVCLNDIWNTWNKYFKCHTNYLSWPQQIINTIDAYKNSSTRYTFPSFHEINLKLGHQFKQLEVRIPDYSLGERCPIFKLKPA